jgi:uncharacterized Tic20 family protein
MGDKRNMRFERINHNERKIRLNFIIIMLILSIIASIMVIYLNIKHINELSFIQQFVVMLTLVSLIASNLIIVKLTYNEYQLHKKYIKNT